jgi:hypothetical protein
MRIWLQKLATVREGPFLLFGLAECWNVAPASFLILVISLIVVFLVLKIMIVIFVLFPVISILNLQCIQVIWIISRIPRYAQPTSLALSECPLS